MIYNDGSTSTLYYYVLNAQGDVIALLNSAGALAASYNYGALGNYSVHGADGKKNTSASFIGHITPLRYRGYYYDRETRLYTGGNSADTSSPENFGGSTPASPQPPKNNGRGNNKKVIISHRSKSLRISS